MTTEPEADARAGSVDPNTVPASEVASTVIREVDRGRLADKPTDVPARGLRDVFGRVRSEAKVDNVPLLSAGVAFYALLALVPAIVAIVSIYGLVADPEQVRAQILDVLRTAPREVRELVSTQLESIASSSSASTIVAVIIGIVAALWSASAGIGHLIDALNVAYDEAETRGAVRRRATALLFTVGAIVFVVVAVGIIGFLPALVARTNLGAPGRVAIGVVRWVALLAGLLAGVAVLYRYGPDRDAAEVAVDVARSHRCRNAVVVRVAAVLALHRELCEVQRDVRLAGCGGRADAVVVSHIAVHHHRCRGERRDGAADSEGHHDGSTDAPGNS